MASGQIEKNSLLPDEVVKQFQDLKDAVDADVKSLKDITSQMDTLKQTMINGGKSVEDLANAEKKLIDLQTQSTIVNQKLKTDYTAKIGLQQQMTIMSKDLQNQIKNENIINNENAGTLEKLKARNSELMDAKKKLNLETEDGRKKLAQYNKEIDANTTKMREADSADEARQHNIGRYAEALDTLSPKLGEIRTSIAELGGALGKLGPIGTGVVAVIGAIAAPFIVFFKTSAEGAEILEQKMAGLKYGMGAFFDVLNKNTKAYVDDKQGFWTTVLNSMKDVFSDETRRKVQASASLGEFLQKQIQETVKNANKLIVPLAEANLKLKEAREYMIDTERSSKERIKAAQDAVEFEKQITELEQTQQKSVLHNIESEKKLMGLRWKPEDEQRLQEAIAKKDEIEAESISSRIRLEKQIANIKKQDEKENLENIHLRLETEKDAIKQSLEALKTAKGTDRDQINATLETQLDVYKKDIAASKIKKLEKVKLDQEYFSFNKDQENSNRTYAEKAAKDLIEEKRRQYELDVKQFQSTEKNKTTTSKLADEEILHAHLEKYKADIEASNLTDVEKKKALDQVTAYEIDANKRVTDDLRSHAENRRKVINDLSRDTIEVEKAASDFYKGIMDAEIQTYQTNSQIKLAKLDSNTKKQLALVEGDAVAQKRINETSAAAKLTIEHDTQVKVAEIKRKEAEMNKVIAISEIAVKTASAVMEVAATGGGMHYLDFGVTASILEAFVISLGALQTAAVLAQPLPSIPQFYKGTKDAPEGYAFVGERGKEGITLPSGERFITPDKATLAYLPKHTKVEPDLNKFMLESLLNVPKLLSTDEKIAQNQLLRDLNKNIIALNKKQGVVVNLDQNGLRISENEGRNWSTYISGRYRN
jgi:hypothetical protein